MFIVGETIRALSKGGEDCSRRAYISCVNDNGTYDIIYALKKTVIRQEQKDEDEECDVPRCRIRKLEPFETISTPLVIDSGSSEGLRGLKYDALATNLCYDHVPAMNTFYVMFTLTRMRKYMNIKSKCIVST